MTQNELLEYNEDGILFPELDFAYLGLARRAPCSYYAAYDLDKVLEFLVKRSGKCRLDCIDELNKKYNVGGDGGPVFILVQNEMNGLIDKNPDALIPSGFEDAYLGFGYKMGILPVAVIDYDKCVEIMVADIDENDSDDQTPEEIAREYLEYNATSAYVGDNTPFYLEKDSEYSD